jgi:starvation-inducible DNA-binding protein
MEQGGAFGDYGAQFEGLPLRVNIFRQVPEALLLERDDEVTDTGIDPALRKEIAAHLYKALADSHVLQLKASRCYWNVKGPIAHGLRHMLKDQVREQIELQDSLGLRIRALSFDVPSSLLEFLELSEIRERGPVHTAEQMLKDLVSGHALLVRNLKSAFPILERASDPATMDVLTHHIAFHESSMRALLSTLQQEERERWESSLHMAQGSNLPS